MLGPAAGVPISGLPAVPSCYAPDVAVSATVCVLFVGFLCAPYVCSFDHFLMSKGILARQKTHKVKRDKRHKVTKERTHGSKRENTQGSERENTQGSETCNTKQNKQ